MSEREVSRGWDSIQSRHADESGKASSSGGENKVKKCGVFLDSQKETVKTPRQPRIPPSAHHDFTITKHPENSKSPSKQHHRQGKHFSLIKL
jgi:hypothetical protein